jgi:ATP-binding cassette subfamily B protein
LLDEPTASLDPISEAEVYEKFNELIGKKTAVYISHRMSSCKFCDRIIFIDNGQIEEEGSHDELMKRGGKYARMFMMQADSYIRA